MACYSVARAVNGCFTTVTPKKKQDKATFAGAMGAHRHPSGTALQGGA